MNCSKTAITTAAWKLVTVVLGLVMRRVCLLLLGLCLNGDAATAAMKDGQPTTSPGAVLDDRPARTDLYGNPLPLGAASRLGTVRLRQHGPGPSRSDEKSVRLALEKIGAQLQQDPDRPNHPIIAVDLAYVEITDAVFGNLKELEHLTRLSLHSTQITDAGLTKIAQCRQLRSLDLSGTKVTSAGLQHLADLPQLSRLDLRFTEINDEGLWDVAKLKELTYLILVPLPEIFAAFSP